MSSLTKRQRLWENHDALMRTWDRIEEEATELFEETHPWLFNPGMKPEIIENEQTIRKENRINERRKNILAEISKSVAELFPPKEPTPPEQKSLIGGTAEVAWKDH